MGARVLLILALTVATIGAAPVHGQTVSWAPDAWVIGGGSWSVDERDEGCAFYLLAAGSSFLQGSFELRLCGSLEPDPGCGSDASQVVDGVGEAVFFSAGHVVEVSEVRIRRQFPVLIVEGQARHGTDPPVTFSGAWWTNIGPWVCGMYDGQVDGTAGPLTLGPE